MPSSSPIRRCARLVHKTMAPFSCAMPPAPQQVRVHLHDVLVCHVGKAQVGEVNGLAKEAIALGVGDLWPVSRLAFISHFILKTDLHIGIVTGHLSWVNRTFNGAVSHG